MGKLVVLMGKSASGKDTIYNILRADESLKLQQLVPYTTRPKRDGEVEGQTYHFVTEEEFDRAIEQATKKKKQDFSKVEFLTYDEGVCVQCMHIGPYDNEPKTVEMMHEFMAQQGYELDITDQRLHHEIYLSDARRVAPEKLKTVIRHPIKRIKVAK